MDLRNSGQGYHSSESAAIKAHRIPNEMKRKFLVSRETPQDVSNTTNTCSEVYQEAPVVGKCDLHNDFDRFVSDKTDKVGQSITTISSCGGTETD